MVPAAWAGRVRADKRMRERRKGTNPGDTSG